MTHTLNATRTSLYQLADLLTALDDDLLDSEGWVQTLDPGHAVIHVPSWVPDRQAAADRLVAALTETFGPGTWDEFTPDPDEMEDRFRRWQSAAPADGWTLAVVVAA